MVAPEGNYCAIPKKRDPQNRSLYPSFHFKPVSFEDPQNQSKLGPSKSFPLPKFSFQTGPVLKIPKINQKWDPQNRSLYPSFHFKPVQFSKGPQNSHFQNFTTRHMRDPSPFPPWLFSEISEQTNNNEQLTDEHQI